MTKTRDAFPIHVRTRWLDYSPALHAHARARIEAALHSSASRVQSVTVRILDSDSRRGARTCEVEVVLRPGGFVVASVTAPDAYSAADLATRRARLLVRRHLARARDVRRAA